MTSTLTDLPVGWAGASLGEVAAFEMGQAPPGSASNFSGQGTVFVKAGEFGKNYPVVREWTTAPLKYAKAGDVLICVVGATAGKLNLGIDCAIGRSVAAVRPNGVVLQKILYRQLQARVTSMRAESTGSAQGVISKEVLAGLSIAVPPLREQHCIADKLDTVLARVDACRDRLARVAPLLKRFRQSVLAAATSGHLTEDLREHAWGAETAWQSVQLKDLARFIDYRGRTPTKTNGGIPLITAKNVRPGYLSVEPREFIAESDYAGWMTRGFPCIGDVLITTEAPLGNVVAIDWPYRFALAQRLICLQFDERIQGRFAAIVLQSPSFQLLLRSNASGSTVAGIQASRLKELAISFPDATEQSEIVRRVETLFAFADRLEVRSPGPRPPLTA